MSALRLLLCAAVLAVVALCASGSRHALAGDLLDTILESGELRLGVRVDAPPFSRLEDGRPAGFSIDLCALVAEEIATMMPEGTDLAVSHRPVGTGQRFDALVTGHIDLLCGATTATLARRQKAAFSLPIYLTGISVAMREKTGTGSARGTGTAAATIERVARNGPSAEAGLRLGGLVLGVRRDTTAADWLDASPLPTLTGTKTRPYESHDSAFAALRTGEIDVYLADRTILLGQIAVQGGAGVMLGEAFLTHEPYALAVPRGEERLRLIVDRVLSRLYRSGEIATLYERYFGPPATSTLAFYRLIALPE
ncbi:MAG: transporter substrate-binding domain-containing protein [Pseudomonadota bacterium]